LTAAEQIQKVMEKLGDFTTLLPQFGALGMDSLKMNIEQGVDPSGVAFADLAPSTIAARGEGHPYGSKPLLDTTNMYQSIHFEVKDANTAWAGPSMEQADYFPFVTEGGANRPARQFIGFRGEDPEEMADLVAEHCSKVVGS
jgi:phage gpG-like protein